MRVAGRQTGPWAITSPRVCGRSDMVSLVIGSEYGLNIWGRKTACKAGDISNSTNNLAEWSLSTNAS
jgi:hypothetical protein